MITIEPTPANLEESLSRSGLTSFLNRARLAVGLRGEVEVLLADGPPDRTVFHCFSGDAALARLAVSHGWYLSFAGPVSFGPNEALREALRVVPPSLLLVETDAPFLTPQPVRKHRNQPAFVAHTAARLAEERGVAYAELEAQVERNAAEVFGW